MISQTINNVSQPATLALLHCTHTQIIQVNCIYIIPPEYLYLFLVLEVHIVLQDLYILEKRRDLGVLLADHTGVLLLHQTHFVLPICHAPRYLLHLHLVMLTEDQDTPLLVDPAWRPGYIPRDSSRNTNGYNKCLKIKHFSISRRQISKYVHFVVGHLGLEEGIVPFLLYCFTLRCFGIQLGGERNGFSSLFVQERCQTTQLMLNIDLLAAMGYALNLD